VDAPWVSVLLVVGASAVAGRRGICLARRWGGGRARGSVGLVEAQVAACACATACGPCATARSRLATRIFFGKFWVKVGMVLRT
jgi:hypothetical protein